MSAHSHATAQTKKTAAGGYAIEVTVTGVKQGDIILFNKYANSESLLVDSLFFDANGHVAFTGSEPLKAGMYNLNFGFNTSVDFFITEGVTQRFALVFDLEKGMSSLAVNGSAENEGFAGYMRFLNGLQQRGNQLQERMQQHQNNPDSANAIGAQLQELNVQVRAEMDKIQQNYPGTTFAFFFKSMMEPEAPAPTISPMSANYDSLMQAYYMDFYKNHFFDNIDFADPRILHVPLLDNLLNVYYTRVLPLDAEVLTQQTDFILEKAKVNREVYEFIIRNRYEFFRNAPYPEIQGVALYIAEKYVVDDAQNWTDKAYPFRMEEVVRLGKLNPAGSVATNLTLKDPDGETVSLHTTDGKYVVLYFFNPGCHSCALVTPVLWELYQEYRAKGLQVFAVYVDRTESDWLPYLTEHKYDWVNGWDPDGTENLYEKYDIHAIPTIYLLDGDKKIIGRDILIEQLKAQMPQLLP